MRCDQRERVDRAAAAGEHLHRTRTQLLDDAVHVVRCSLG
jgi:hypothetical protein